MFGLSDSVCRTVSATALLSMPMVARQPSLLPPARGAVVCRSAVKPSTSAGAASATPPAAVPTPTLAAPCPPQPSAKAFAPWESACAWLRTCSSRFSTSTTCPKRLRIAGSSMAISMPRRFSAPRRSHCQAADEAARVRRSLMVSSSSVSPSAMRESLPMLFAWPVGNSPSAASCVWCLDDTLDWSGLGAWAIPGLPRKRSRGKAGLRLA
mmetsp:Transcript_111467/g.315584  ORF Transcript_111467/g.315584 Transcript_111467/m.315584 type:complete len:210 (+) Transcript_111467:1088-1717(+)